MTEDDEPYKSPTLEAARRTQLEREGTAGRKGSKGKRVPSDKSLLRADLRRSISPDRMTSTLRSGKDAEPSSLQKIGQFVFYLGYAALGGEMDVIYQELPTPHPHNVCVAWPGFTPSNRFNRLSCST